MCVWTLIRAAIVYAIFTKQNRTAAMWGNWDVPFFLIKILMLNYVIIIECQQQCRQSSTVCAGKQSSIQIRNEKKIFIQSFISGNLTTHKYLTITEIIFSEYMDSKMKWSRLIPQNSQRSMWRNSSWWRILGLRIMSNGAITSSW